MRRLDMLKAREILRLKHELGLSLREIGKACTVADGALDRVIHNAYVLETNSKKSMREVMAGRLLRGLNNPDFPGSML